MSKLAVEPPAMPSADLIKYRFDKLDETMNSFDIKLEQMIADRITKADILELKVANDKRVSVLEARVDALEGEVDQVKGAIVMLKAITALVTLMAMILGALWWTK